MVALGSLLRRRLGSGHGCGGEGHRRLRGESDLDTATGDATWPAWLESEGSLLIFSAETGALVARDAVSLPLHSPNSGAAVAAWLGPDDALVHRDRVDGRLRLEVLLPDGTDSAIVSPKAPWTTEDTDVVWLAGSDATSAIAATSQGFDYAGYSDMFSVGRAGEPSHLGMLPATVTVLCDLIRQAAVAGIVDGMSEWVVYLSDVHGGSRTSFELSGPDSENAGD